MTFAFSVVLDDPTDAGGTYDTGLVTDLTAAAADWAQYITSNAGGTLVIELMVGTLGSGVLADGAPTYERTTGTIEDGRTFFVPSSVYELETGQHTGSANASDITVEVNSSELSDIYINPDPATAEPVPSNEYDALSIFRHEIGHGLGFGGFTTSSGTIGADETAWDHYLVKNADGTATFDGPDAEAVYGGPVPITTLSNGEGYAHVGNSVTGPLGQDLMNGVGMYPGTTYDISAVDLAMLDDVGVPVTSMPCFAAGTRIATPDGERPAEAIRAGDRVLAASGEALEVVWVGRRRVSLARHPQPTSVAPVRILAGAFAAGVPARDLVLSPDHAVAALGVLIPISRLINGLNVVQEFPRAIDYRHIEVRSHAVLLAEGLAAESYLDTGNREQFAGGAVTSLNPDFRRRHDRGTCLSLEVAGPRVARLRRLLCTRALRSGLRPESGFAIRRRSVGV